jgi:hypothetical protein
MSTVAIDINDVSLAVASESGVLAVEPGFARVDAGGIVTGEAARARARLQPRRTSSRFWSALSMEPGSAGSDIGKSAAELAYAQLESLWRSHGQGVGDVVLVVPGAYRTEQLGLLLGLALECGMPVRALVDTAAAASVRPYPGRQLMYVDAGFQRISVTLLEQTAKRKCARSTRLARVLRPSPTCSRGASPITSCEQRASIRSLTPIPSRRCSTACRHGSIRSPARSASSSLCSTATRNSA